ncbi:uncharacterized protein V1516DRAFT_650810 [Lipomyces oligophaga]|uniref:uncharacterized protein n=1 Tax=Lipomyces oligophaga TaxID=45792 RepID=UPI0034CD1BA1
MSARARPPAVAPPGHGAAAAPAIIPPGPASAPLLAHQQQQLIHQQNHQPQQASSSPAPAPPLPILASIPHPASQFKRTEQLNYEQYVTRDALQAAAFKDHTDRHIAFLRQKRQEIETYESFKILRQQNPGAVFGQGYAGFGNGLTAIKPGIIGTRDRRRVGRMSREVRISRELMSHQATTDEQLVPVRLDLEFDKTKIRDTFTWNLNDKSVPLEIFAENLCEDFTVPLYHSQTIARSIAEQVHEFQPHIFDPTIAKTVDPTLPYTAYKDDDMRIVVKLDITIGQHNLVDQFEWDINDPQNVPEEFARSLCEELSLPPEFITAIAHSIREQAQLYTKSLLLVGHPFDGRPIEDDEIRREMCPSVTDLLRPQHQLRDFTPVLYELSEADLTRADKDSERENRWKRRQGRSVGRRGGIVLPDLREPMRTFRTPIVNSVLPCAIERSQPTLVPTAISEEERVDTPHSYHHGPVRRTRHTTGNAHSTPSHNPTLIATPSGSAKSAQSPLTPGKEVERLMICLKGKKIKAWMLSNPSKFVPLT